MGLTHFEEATSRQAEVGHLRSTWTYLGHGAGSVDVGVNRIKVADGGWSTPAHEHGRDEEIFYVLDGTGVLWVDGSTAEVGAGDCFVCRPGEGAHTLYGVDGLDVLAFGTRAEDESVGFPRLGLSRIGNRVVETQPGEIDNAPVQWVREAQLGAPELPAEHGERPSTLVNVDAVRPRRFGRSRVSAMRRDLGSAVGSERTGLEYVEVEAGRQATPQHCHSMEEEIFVVLAGGGILVLGEDEIAVRPGHVISRPPATGVAHMFRAGDEGLTFLAYGTREPGDVCYYPQSNKISFRGIGVVARLERLDYWDGED